MEAAGRMISEDVIWIGTGKYGLVRGRETVLNGFRETKAREDYVYRILSAEYEVTCLDRYGLLLCRGSATSGEAEKGGP